MARARMCAWRRTCFGVTARGEVGSVSSDLTNCSMSPSTLCISGPALIPPPPRPLAPPPAPRRAWLSIPSSAVSSLANPDSSSAIETISSPRSHSALLTSCNQARISSPSPRMLARRSAVATGLGEFDAAADRTSCCTAPIRRAAKARRSDGGVVDRVCAAESLLLPGGPGPPACFRAPANKASTPRNTFLFCASGIPSPGRGADPFAPPPPPLCSCCCSCSWRATACIHAR